MTQEDQNLQSLFANLNQVSRNTMIREKSGGGTGGGSDLVEGSMDPNTLMTGNPYIAKNVVEFGFGGMFDNFGGLLNTVGSGGGAINLGGFGGVGGVPTGAINTLGNTGFGSTIGNVINPIAGTVAGQGIGINPTGTLGNIFGSAINPITGAVTGNIGSTENTGVPTAGTLGSVFGSVINPVTNATTENTGSTSTGTGNVMGGFVNPVINAVGNITSGSGDTSSTGTSEAIDDVISPVADAVGNIVSPSSVNINRGVKRRRYNDKRKFDSGGMYGSSPARPVVSGVPQTSNPYLQKINQLVGLQQMVNVGKGLANNVLQQEAMMSAPKAAYGMKMKKKYTNGGRF